MYGWCASTWQWKQPRAVLVEQLLYPRLTVNHLRYDPGERNMVRLRVRVSNESLVRAGTGSVGRGVGEGRAQGQ